MCKGPYYELYLTKERLCNQDSTTQKAIFKLFCSQDVGSADLKSHQSHCEVACDRLPKYT